MQYLVPILFALPLAVHDTEAHFEITQDALKVSERLGAALAELEADSFEAPVGNGGGGWLPTGVLFRPEHYPAIAAQAGFVGVPATARGMILSGSVLEDGVGAPWFNPGGLGTLLWAPQELDFTVHRCTHHFQNALGHGLPKWHGGGEYFPAQGWAENGDGGDHQSNLNKHTWTRALNQYEVAVMAKQPEDRRDALETMLVSVGCNLHLLQDQFSPAHTLDDPHPGHDVPLLDFIEGHSLLEVREKHYINQHGLNEFARPHVAPVRLPGHASYFSSAVAWTSERFFSDDTIPAVVELMATPHVACTEEGLCQVLGFPLEWGCNFVSTSSELHEAPRLARSRNRLLPSLTVPPGPETTLEGSYCDVRGIDSIIYDNLVHLVPEATAYTAGLLDHFLRGRILVEQDGDELRITNDCHLGDSGDAQQGWIQGGEFLVLQELESGERELRLEVPVAAGGLGLGATQTIVVPDSLLEGAGDARLVVLLRGGQIGQEAGLATAALDWSRPIEVCHASSRRIWSGGDLNADGVTDVVLTHVDCSLDQVIAVSGADRSVIWATGYDTRFTQPKVAAIGDLNGDGHEDLLLAVGGGCQSPGLAYRWLSGVDGAILADAPLASYSDLHLAVGDLSGDGISEITNRLGWEPQVRILDGSTGAELHEIPIEVHNAGIRLGLDWDGDGARDLRIKWGLNGMRVRSSRTGTLLFEGHYGQDIRDLDFDGIPDLVRPTQSPQGYEAISSATLERIWHSPECRGGSPPFLSDFDGDGVDDLLFAGSLEDVLTGSQGGDSSQVLLVVNPISGAIHDLQYLDLELTTNFQPFHHFLPIGDTNGDLAEDCLYLDVGFVNWSIQSCLRTLLGE